MSDSFTLELLPSGMLRVTLTPDQWKRLYGALAADNTRKLRKQLSCSVTAPHPEPPQ